MNFKQTLRMGFAALVLISGGLFAPASVHAQGPPPEMMAKIKKLQKWMEQHKSAFGLGDLLYQIGQVNKTPGFALTKPQAQKLLAIMKPLQPKTELSEDQAKATSKAMTNVLTTKQLQKVATIETPRQKMQKQRGAGAPRPGGAAGGKAGFTIPDPPKGGYNPLNPSTFPFVQFRPQMKAAMDQFVAGLQHAK